ncbi:MAG TPA: isoleucine--tRNA ligase [Frankiaceae bacterium]|nr:isoleucine--tRNA ligase [Frankiaceae bacterium]
MTKRFEPAPAQLDLPALERRVLDRWEAGDVFGRSLAQTKDGPVWAFYDGPPTANGKPGIHHAEPRVFKDVFCRYRAMTGHYVPRRAGWDCHGLPVELAVEKELGFSGKQEIERYGIEAFNAKCRESVLRHVAEHQELSRRMGYWVDQVNAYRTMDPDYVDAVWWSLKVVFDKGLLVEDHRVAPYCPRCGTALSDHEVAQGYAMVEDPSVFVRFPLVDDDRTLLIWTTTPWTLVSNTAVAVHPDVTYVTARVGDERLVVAESLVEKALGEGAVVEERFPGRDLERRRYRRPFDHVEIPDAHYVTLATYVTTEDGTGLVHTAPAFGAEDLAVCREYGLPVVNPITGRGEFADTVPMVGGMFFKDADAPLTADLEARGLLWRSERYEHSYAHCWRCDTPLINYATPAWYIRTTAIKDRLLAENARTDWHPETIRDGRYGDWLVNNIDWSLSRSRYWGTPLPIWRCPDDHLTCVGSRRELGELAGADYSELDPHRPFVDDVALPCRECGETARRVPEVIDCWYDAGSMPFAQWGAPHRNAETFEQQYPAKFIAEAIDQTRGWFYTLMAIGTLVFERSSYETVLCLGHIVDDDGRKMSKHLGNILEPFELFDRHGADPVRWLLLCVGTPWLNRRVGHAGIEEAVRKVLLTYWNTVSFFTLYASTADWAPGGDAGEPTAMDRWLTSELHATVAEVTESLETFDTTRAGRRLTQFVDDLSNWYVRRGRRRFWKADPAALATLHSTLLTLTQLMAPFVPFLTEEVWDRLHGDGDSVHLTSWPVADPALVDETLSRQMALVRRLVELGRATRAESGVKTRQPLGRALVGAAGWADLPDELRAQVAEELNVLALDALDESAGLVDVSVKPNFRALGKRFGKDTPRIANAVTAADPAALAAGLAAGSATVTVDGEDVALTAEDVVVTESPREGWAVSSEAGATVALDLKITPALRLAGLARDAVRVLQESRKATGLDVSDRIELWWEASGELADALEAHGGAVAEEVLAVAFTRGAPARDLAPHSDRDLGLTWWLRGAGR